MKVYYQYTFAMVPSSSVQNRFHAVRTPYFEDDAIKQCDRLRTMIDAVRK